MPPSIRDAGGAGLVRHLWLRRQPSGELITLANAKNIPLGGTVLFRRVPEPAWPSRSDPARPNCRAGWTPATDKHPDGLGMCPAHRARAWPRRTAARKRRRLWSGKWDEWRRMHARSPIGCSRSPPRRAGRPKRWSTTNSPRNGRISKTSRQTLHARSARGTGRHVPGAAR